MAKPAKRYPVTYVEWVDAAIVQGVWTEPKPALKRARGYATRPMRSAGFLVDQTPESITLALSHNPTNHDLALIFVIPRSAITKMNLWSGGVDPDGDD